MKRAWLPWLAGLAAALWFVRRMARPHRDFAGTVVLITGASRGIGRALALAFARRGAHLVLAARSAGELDAVAAEARALNPQVDALAVPTDVTDLAALEHLTERALAHFGRVDVLVNNAGVLIGGRIADLPVEVLDRHIDVNLTAPVRLTWLVLPHMLARDSGLIINMVSVGGRAAGPNFAAYAATKHAMGGFTNSLRRELDGTGVRVLRVNPGFTQTDMVEHVGASWERMGHRLIPLDEVVDRTLYAAERGLLEVNIGLIATLGGTIDQLFPALIDLYWRMFAPPDFDERTRRQRSR